MPVAFVQRVATFNLKVQALKAIKTRVPSDWHAACGKWHVVSGGHKAHHKAGGSKVTNNILQRNI